MNNKFAGEIITFYSYKGGTGRSMALANVACLLSPKENANEKVLMIDWDLEAPGLHQFFRGKFKGIAGKTGDLPHGQLGLIDLFYEVKSRLMKQESEDEIPGSIFNQIDIRKYIIKINDPLLYFMPAGRFDDKLYSARVNEFNWSDFFDKFPLFISQFAQYLRENYKYTLIDSRTGYTDISGICTSIMPEKLITVFTPNRQSLFGVVEMIRRAIDYRKQSDDLRPLMIFPLPSRIENAESELQKEWRFGNSKQGFEGYQMQLASVLTDAYNLQECDLTKYFDEYQLQYVPRYSYGEEISVLSERPEDRLSLARSFESFAERIISSKNPWEKDVPWLINVGLKENPFRYQDAEESDPYLTTYFSRFPELQTVTANDLIRERKTWIFWGKEGSGKTALRKFLAARGRPQNSKADIFCIEVDQVKFEQLLFSIDDISEFRIHFIRSIYETCLRNFPTETINIAVSWHDQNNLQENLANLSVSLRQHDINWVLCLVDPGKEFFTWKGSKISTASLLAPLLSFPDVGGVGFRYFLPESVKEELQTTFSALSRNQRRLMQIAWDEDALKKLIGKRMTALSLDQTAPYRSLGELCDDDKNLSSSIDAEIATLAQGNPRGAIWMANRLIEMHCQNPVPASRISPETWDDVKSVWWSSGESRILGIPESSNLRVLGEHIFFRSHEITLSGRSDQLLRCLVQAKGGFSSKEELITAGWPGENQSGVSEKALSEAMRRMKEELKRELNAKGLEGFDWIKSVRGRGYRLVYPDMVTKAGEEEYD